MNILTVTYTGLSNDLLEQAMKDTLRQFNYVHLSTFLRALNGTWEMEFRKLERQYNKEN